MSSIYKLSIKGIRSFEPESDETIQFGFPLTLICGQNGCGKTTVIECLRYATTGNLPPNSKGGAFVHDPSLSSRTSVTGQVKLAFKNANGKSMITTRSVQASIKNTKSANANTITFKSMEGQLAYIENGKKTSISSKNAELDSQVPIFLGASTAILDNVIFCHQDESLWPLSEASVLKKKFDDIFEASKFTKVIDNLKSIKKDMATDIKLIEQSVNHLKIDKDRAKKVRDRLAEMNHSVDTFAAEISELNIQIEQKDLEAEKLFATNQEFQKTLSDYENLLMKKASLDETIDRIKSSIEILPDSDEELFHKQENFAAIVAENKESIGKLQKVEDGLNTSLREKTEEYNEMIRLDGSLKAKRAEYDANKGKLTKLMNENAKEIKINLGDDESRNLTNFKNAITAKLVDLQKEEKELISNYRSIEVESQKQLKKIEDEIIKDEQSMEYIERDLQKSQQSLSSFKKRLDASSNDESELVSRKDELDVTIKELDNKKSKKEVKELDIKITKANAENAKLEFELDEVAKKLSTSSEQSELRTRIKFLEDEIKLKNAEITKISQKINNEYKEVVGGDLDIDFAEPNFKEKYEELKSELDSQQKKVYGIQSEIDSLMSSRSGILNNISNNSLKIDELKTDITEVIQESEIDEYENILRDLEEDYRNVTEDVNTSEVTKSYGKSALEMAEKNKCCLLCKRMFDDPALTKFIAELRQGFDEEKIRKVKRNAEEIGKELDATKSISLKVINYRECVALKPKLEKELSIFDDKINTLNNSLKSETKTFESLRHTFESANDLKKPLDDASRLNHEVQDLDFKVDKLNDELDEFGSAVGSVEELQKQQRAIHVKIREVRQEVSDLSDEKYKVQKDIQRLENNVKDTKLTISNLERSLAEVSNIKRSIEDSETSIASLESKSKEMRSKLLHSRKDRDRASHELEQVQIDHSLAGNKMSKRIKSLNTLVESFQTLLTAMSDFEAIELPKMKKNSDNMEAIVKECDSIKAQILENSSEIRKYEKLVMDSSRVEHNIMSNIDYRAQINRLDETEFQLNSMDIENAQLQKEEYQQNSKRIRDEISNLSSEHAGKVGEVKQIKDQIETLKKELATEYKNVDEMYHEEWIKLQTNLLVSNDIQNYSKALDNAIMKYHSIKMEDINRILTELWSQTYQGTDISTIAIKSDVNLQTKGNRSYNYRVVMVKDSSELDMRGRCSAGQKVLASILIRLALAECFGSNCGIIALDEPTTNLDSENAEALATALNRVIDYRKRQSNFQLIVITHDEKFLSHLRGFTDHYYRIDRDEKSKSRIYRMSFATR
ncbi:Rad50 DNA double-strand break repair factor [Candida orthopsilosis Co 90-125]|uniref:DNA repair protein RAD50 n=1 Tax=Candida orthopsilosis (strain 90-125) TaxID=1136231 RepID=H8X2H6_CANO9|nr:Rad50 DNA double-strand break repair factor [Candida orthopsilosis Co 90-125]CCG25523.1 Rad50 DNA double-strand break repair factor [Candida orthopsilosis Co 90-125]